MTLAMIYTRVVGRYESNGNAEFLFFAQQVVGVVHLESQSKNRGHRCESDIALVPGQRQTETFLALILTLADDTAINNRSRITARLGAGQGEAGYLVTTRETGKITLPLLVGTVLH